MVFNSVREEKISIDEIRQVFEKIVQIQKKLAIERKARGLTQKEMAKKLGWKQSEVSRFENSEVLPRIDTVMIYAHCLGYELDLNPSFEHKALENTIISAYFEDFLVRDAFLGKWDDSLTGFASNEEPVRPLTLYKEKEGHHECA